MKKVITKNDMKAMMKRVQNDESIAYYMDSVESWMESFVEDINKQDFDHIRFTFSPYCGEKSKQCMTALYEIIYMFLLRDKYNCNLQDACIKVADQMGLGFTTIERVICGDWHYRPDFQNRVYADNHFGMNHIDLINVSYK